ncbi:unnamed protein product [Xylocopa violacea]|uniref:Odorant receptor n=1 Tax=Xylocopa violacea TaxID=135666 RepID=A0ABP1NHA8_XYLVO
MFRDATPEKTIAFVRYSVALTYCWPLPSTATKSRVFRFKILRFLVLLNAFMLLGPLLYAMHVHRDDPGKVSKAALLSLAIMQVLVQTSFCAVHYNRFQRLIEEMELCCENATSCERLVFQRYIGQYSVFYGMSAIWFYVTATIVVLGTILVPGPLTTNPEYPFPVDFEPLRSFLYVHQGLVGLQCSAHACVNAFCALLLLFAAARYENLMTELRAVTDAASLIKCIEKYYIVKRYARDAVHAVRFIALITVTLCGIAVVFSGISFVGRQPFNVKIQSFSLAATGLLEVFMCALPADHLMDMSETVMQKAYESEWYEQRLKIQKCILFTLVPQPPVVLSIKCIIPALSLRYYCSFISNVFSLFTALRIVMVKDEDDN